MTIPRFIPADATPAELARMGISPQSSPAPVPAVAPEPTPAPSPSVPSETAGTPAPDATTEPAQGELIPASGVYLPPLPIDPNDPTTATTYIPPEEQTPEERAEVARMAGTVELAFPVVGFIDPSAELEKLLRITQQMAPDVKAAYPERVRAAILAHEAGKGPEVSDEELALAIFIKRTTDTPLTEEELEAKATGKKKRDPAAVKPIKTKTAKTSAEQLKNILGL